MIIYLIIIILVLLSTSLITVNIVENALLSRNVSQGIDNVYDFSLSISDDLHAKDAESLYNAALEKGKDHNYRVLIVNQAGIVQVDTYSKLNGVRLNTKEILQVLTGVSDNAYGYHQIDNNDSGTFWAAYYVSAVIHDSQRVGAVVFSESLQDITDSSAHVTGQMAVFFALSLVLVGVITFFLTDHITKPIENLKKAAEKIAEGDYTVKVIPMGTAEMVELADVFNRMSEQIDSVDKKRSEFISNASHELKTPITSMKILAESLLANDNVPAEVYRDFLSDINVEMDRLNSLVKDLLLLTKLENAETTLVFEYCGIREMCERVTRMLSPLAEQKGIELSCSCDEDIMAYCSKTTIYEAINNLTENAIKYTQSGGSITISAKINGKFVDVAVKDTGEGISEEDQKHLFERFYRVDKARSRATGGTGLGLHIVFQIAKAHGGRVLVESEKGKGSTFTLRFLMDKEETK